jgi:hypothetical protein
MINSIVLLSLVATALAFPYSLHAQEAEASSPNLNLILDSLERTEEQLVPLHTSSCPGRRTI